MRRWNGMVCGATGLAAILGLLLWSSAGLHSQVTRGPADGETRNRAPAPDDDVAPQRTRPGLPRAVVNTHDLMNLFNRPFYEYLREEMQDEPANEEDWETLEERSLQAAEIANLVAIRRVADEHQPRWQMLSANLQQAGLNFHEAAQSRDYDQTLRAYQELIRSCNTCHRTIAPDDAPQLEP